MHQPRSLLSSFATMASVHMSTNVRNQSHYDTLGITPKATQNDIKSAYYKLSKQYHPDINQEKKAKEKFRKISEAYEVLGNYDLRKQYDRGMFIRDTRIPKEKVKMSNDPYMRFYRSHAETQGKPNHQSHIFNFDEWTRAHYGDMFNKTLKLKKNLKTMKKEHESESTESEFKHFAKLIVMFTMSLAIATIMIYKDYDDVSTVQSIRERNVPNNLLEPKKSDGKNIQL